MYVKIRFTNGTEHTAGLVLTTSTVRGMGVGELSRLYPVSEARCMARLQISPAYSTWDLAFTHEFAS
jgi:hypothetical protein